MPNIAPCIWLDDQAQQAASLYTSVFPRSRITATAHYSRTRDNPGHMPRGSVMTVELDLAGTSFTLLNGGPILKPGPTVSFFVNLQTAAEVDTVFNRLAEGGKVFIPLDRWPWSERYGWIQDRFGVSWQVMKADLAPGDDVIVPCLMFSGNNAGRAEAALRRYAEVFPGSSVTRVEHYTGNEGPAGQVKHGRASLSGHALVCMDSHVEHDATFDEGVSLQVMCRDQAEVDRFWAALSDDGSGTCGWLKDRFGVSWQVVPSSLRALMSSADEPARDRMLDALYTMKKLDVAALQRAHDGNA